MNTLTTGKANRQRKNARKYEVTKIKVERKKKAKADKKTVKKSAWKKKGVKKNGKLVKGSLQHQELLAKIKEQKESVDGIADGHTDSNTPDGGSVVTSGSAI